MKHASIERHRRVWLGSVQCQMLEVSVAGYHEYLNARAGNRQRRHLSDDALLVHIKAIHGRSHASNGWPRSWRELLCRGIPVGKNRVQKLMQQHAIRAKGKRRFGVITDSNHNLAFSLNLLDRRVTVDEPDRVWSGIKEGKLFELTNAATPVGRGRDALKCISMTGDHRRPDGTLAAQTARASRSTPDIRPDGLTWGGTA